MPIVVTCAQCGKRGRLQDSEAGKPTICPVCGHQFTVPGQVEEMAPEPETASPPPGARVKTRSITLVLGTVLAIGAAVGAYAVVRHFTAETTFDRAAALKVEGDALASQNRLAEAKEDYAQVQKLASAEPSNEKLTRLGAEATEALMRLAPTSRVAVAAPAHPSTLPASPTTHPSLSATAPAASPSSASVVELPVAVPPVASPEAPSEPASPIVAAPTVTKPGAQVRAVNRPPIHATTSSPGLTDEQIGKSIQRGVDYLIKQFDPKTSELSEKLRVSRGGGRDGYKDGADVLTVYALLQCSEAIDDPRLNQRGQFMLGAIEATKYLPMDDRFGVYGKALRATGLALINRKEDRKILRMDVAALLKNNDHGRYTYFNQRPSSSNFDNSNSQYGLLGVWSGAEAEVEVPGSYWADVEKHWASVQCKDGSWSYTDGRESGNVPMTCAGVASLFVCHDYLDAPRVGAAVGREPYSPALKKGLAWLEAKDRAVDMENSMIYGYTLYGVERVGLASGFKFFGKHNWYPELAARTIVRQEADGSWQNVVDTSYALLFLSRGRHPIMMNKLRFDGAWANRPRDVAMLSREASKQLEHPINWQVTPLDVPWQQWSDAPILYMASHHAPKLSDAQVDQIRGFVQAGGMLFLHADGNSGEMGAFAADLGHRLFPAYSLADVPNGHPLFTSMYRLTSHPPLKMVTNGARILMLYSSTDIARRWQQREFKSESGKPIFQMGLNMFVYAAGRRNMRNRLDVDPTSEELSSPSKTIRVARLSYTGDWDPEPYAWKRYAHQFQKQTGYALDVKQVAMNALAAGEYPFAVLTGVHGYEATQQDKDAVREYVNAGGVLLVDMTGGAGEFDASYRALLQGAFPKSAPRSISPKHHIFLDDAPGAENLSHVRLRPYAIEKIGNNGGDFEIISSGKGHVITTAMDLTSGLLNTNTWGIAGYEPSYSQALIKNLILWTIDGHPDK